MDMVPWCGVVLVDMVVCCAVLCCGECWRVGSEWKGGWMEGWWKGMEASTKPWPGWWGLV